MYTSERVCVCVWVQKCRERKKRKRREKTGRSRCRSLPGRLGTTTAMKAKHKKEEKKKEEGRHESEGVSCKRRTPRLDETTRLYLLSNSPSRLASRQDRRLSTTSSADNALVLVDQVGTMCMKVLYFYARMLQSLKQLMQH